MPILRRFRPALKELLAPALTTGPDLGPDGDAAIQAWQVRACRVRTALDAWRRLGVYSRVLGYESAEIRVAQIPHSTPPERWVALPFGDEVNRPPGGRLSLVLERVGTPSVTDPWVGLLLDEWSERIPLREEDAGVVFQYDAPGTEAPSAILLAVTPDGHKNWSLDYLEETVNETFDLAKIRAVDTHGLGAMDQVLPMTYLAANPQNQAISTSFVGMLMAEAVIEGQ
jgi:hypothetical protein